MHEDASLKEATLSLTVSAARLRTSLDLHEPPIFVIVKFTSRWMHDTESTVGISRAPTSLMEVNFAVIRLKYVRSLSKYDRTILPYIFLELFLERWSINPPLAALGCCGCSPPLLAFLVVVLVWQSGSLAVSLVSITAPCPRQVWPSPAITSLIC